MVIAVVTTGVPLGIIVAIGLMLSGCDKTGGQASNPSEPKGDTPAPTEVPVIPTARSLPEMKTSPAVPAEPRYVIVEPFLGVKMELPADWRAFDSEATDVTPPSTPVDTLVELPGFARGHSSWGFAPPGHVGAEVNIALNPHPATQSRQKDLPPETIAQLASTFGEALGPILDAKGYRLHRTPQSERVRSGDRPTLLWQDEATSATDGIMVAQVLFVPLEKADVVATFLWLKTPDHAWEPAIEHARTSLRVADRVGTPVP